MSLDDFIAKNKIKGSIGKGGRGGRDRGGRGKKKQILKKYLLNFYFIFRPGRWKSGPRGSRRWSGSNREAFGRRRRWFFNSTGNVTILLRDFMSRDKSFQKVLWRDWLFDWAGLIFDLSLIRPLAAPFIFRDSPYETPITSFNLSSVRIEIWTTGGSTICTP